MAVRLLTYVSLLYSSLGLAERVLVARSLEEMGLG